MPERLAFFDIDNTLLKRSTGEYFLREACRQGVVPLPLLLSIPILCLLYSFRGIHWDTWQRQIPGIEGIPKDTFARIADRSFERRYRPSLFPEMQTRIASLHVGGIPVWLATSSVDFMVKPIADYLETDGLIASALEFRDGMCTGRFAGKPVFGREKLSRVRARAHELGVSLSDCSFYSDSVHDLPLLEAAGTPVAVNPDCHLAKIAKRRGWQIIRC